MKKMLVLAMVMGLTSLASAGLSFTVDGDVVQFGADVMPGDLGLFEKETNSIYDITLVLEDVIISTESLNAIAEYDFATAIIKEDSVSVRISASQFASDPVGGGLFDGIMFNLTEGVTKGKIRLIDHNAGDVELGYVNVVPEPMTMVLLGLGGIFLRKRRT